MREEEAAIVAKVAAAEDFEEKAKETKEEDRAPARRARLGWTSSESPGRAFYRAADSSARRAPT